VRHLGFGDFLFNYQYFHGSFKVMLLAIQKNVDIEIFPHLELKFYLKNGIYLQKRLRID
jgi:hypothetical protein